MSNYGCPQCLIVYSMISDATPNPICKKCGKAVVYWDENFVKTLPNHAAVKYDHIWNSILATKADVDPNYDPDKFKQPNER